MKRLLAVLFVAGIAVGCQKPAGESAATTTAREEAQANVATAEVQAERAATMESKTNEPPPARQSAQPNPDGSPPQRGGRDGGRGGR